MRDKGVLSDLNIGEQRKYSPEVPADLSNCQSVAMIKILVFRSAIIGLKFSRGLSKALQIQKIKLSGFVCSIQVTVVRESRRQASWNLSRSGRTERRICRQNLKKARAVGLAVNE